MTISRLFQKYIQFQTFFLLTFSIMFFSAVPGETYELLIGTDEPGSFSFFAGRTICHAINKQNDDVFCRPVTASDHAHNLTNLQGGSLDMALVNSKLIHDALTHSGYYRYMDIDYSNLRYLLPLYKVPISLIVNRNAGIETFNDLRGKRVNSGAPMSLQNLIFNDLMAVMKWQSSDFSLLQSLPASHAQDMIAFNTGTVQAMLHIGVHPDVKLARDLNSSRGKMVGVNEAALNQLIDKKTGFSRCSIPAGTYPQNPEKIHTLAMETMLITNEDIDDPTVTMVLDSILAAQKRLQQAHPCLLGKEVQIDTVFSCDLPSHPAAALYFLKKKMKM